MRVDKLVPEVYYKESRDFAYIGRLIEVLFNYMKTSADCVNMNIDHENIDSNLVDLFVNTLGFELRHSYSNKDLVFIASAFSTLLKNKGTLTAINLAIRLLLNSQGIKNSDDFEFCNFDVEKSELNINIPSMLSDIILLEDLFDYILPAGIIYKFTEFGEANNTKATETKSSSQLCNITSTDQDSINKLASVYVYDTDLGAVENKNLGIIKGNETESDIHDALGSIYTGIVVSDPTVTLKEDEYNDAEQSLTSEIDNGGK